MLFVRYNGQIHRDNGGIVLKCLQKPKPFSVFCEHQKSRDSLAYDNLTENRSWNLWKFKWKFGICYINILHKKKTYICDPQTQLNNFFTLPKIFHYMFRPLRAILRW
jgi:hypothetical protein